MRGEERVSVRLSCQQYQMIVLVQAIVRRRAPPLVAREKSGKELLNEGKSSPKVGGSHRAERVLKFRSDHLDSYCGSVEK